VLPVGVKLVALDVDGTLIPPGAGPDALPDGRISAAVAALQEAGKVVVLASGRMYPGTARIARHFRLRTPLICQQGASIHLPGGEMTHCFPVDGRIAREIVGFARDLDRSYAWFNAVRYIASSANPASDEYGKVSGITPEYRPDPENSGIEPTGVDIISTEHEAAHIHRLLVHRYGERLHVLDFPSVTVAVAPEANKGHALSLLCSDLGIDRHEVLAIGDSVNDAPMLAWAGRGVAMPHGDRYAIDAADEVLDGEGIEGVARLLETLVRGDSRTGAVD
jgi:Cof subfamily protein (haloacid dehalogenase superfamily)